MRTTRGLTLVEVIVTLVVVALLVLFFFPFLWIQAFGDGSRAHDVAEQDGDRLALTFDPRFSSPHLFPQPLWSGAPQGAEPGFSFWL